MQWPIWVTAETRSPSGRRVRMSRMVEGAGDAVGAMLRALRARKDKGIPFAGCEIRGMTKLGQVILRVLNPDTLDFDVPDKE